MRMLLLIAVGVTTLAAARSADAIPRFAARNGMECIQCHINPTGGGIRNAYGRNVFERTWLPSTGRPAPRDWIAEPPPPVDDGDRSGDDGDGDRREPVVFDPEINPWMVLGGDMRLAYIYVRPDRGASPGQRPDITSSFFLMQADLYHAATLNDHVTTVLDIGVYSGFEAWALYHLRSEPSNYDLMVKVGRFMPPFGIREVEHQLFTRQGIGLGNADRDTGLELTGFAGPVTLNLAVLNGTFGETAFDNHGTTRRRFEKAVAARLSVRGDAGWSRGQLGLSFYANRDNNQANPLLAGSIPSADLGQVGVGVDEVRAGGFATLNVGRFTYLGEVDWVRDRFYSDALPPLSGYVSYQELSFLPVQGVDLIGTLEFADPDLEIADDGVVRAGAVIEVFPWPFTELRAMVRRTWDDAAPTGGSWDVVVFSHVFM